MRTQFLLLLPLLLLISVVSGRVSAMSADGAVTEKGEPEDLPHRNLPGFFGRGGGGEKIKSWPELIGKSGDEAKQAINDDMPELIVVVLPHDAMVTRDFRLDRVRVFVDENNVVVKAPSQG